MIIQRLKSSLVVIAVTAMVVGCASRNCVTYARSTLVPDLPMGLHTIADKRRHITSTQPQIGYSAVMKPNHIAVVVGISPLHITVRHENWPSGSKPRYTTFDRADPRIYGYIPTSLKKSARKYIR